ncbi:MAG: SIS domain-containing protein [Lachnospiraceae bacterium]|jgi:fructoselysine-6-phosphate deglycase|nr:SIS domain-containing protein [Lachnospiraceae bacterium]
MIERNSIWAEKKEPSLRDFNEKEKIASVNGALALRGEIERIVDKLWEEGFDGIYFMGIGGTYASGMQVEVYMRGKSSLPVYVENAAEFLTTGNKRFTKKSVLIYSSVSGNTGEMVKLVQKVKSMGARVFAFIDTPGSTLTEADKQDYLIVYPMNEQLKFYMVANYLMYKNGEFADYEEYNAQMEQYLAKDLVQVEKEADAWAYEYAKEKVAFLNEHRDLPHYFIGSGNQYGATYSYAMCYWEEQMWIRTKSISCQEFFHGMQEIIVADTPVTLFIGEDEQRPLAERVARFLPKVNGNYTIIDTREYAMEGISEKYRGSLSHLIMRAVNARVDTYMELFLRHPLSIRRYYRQFDY